MVSILLILILALSLFAGCGEKKTDETSKESGTKTEAKTEDKKEEKKEDKKEEPAKDKVLIVRTYGDPMSFNPDSTADDNAYAMVQNIYNRLVKLDASKQVIPDLAKTWDVSEDGLTVTFHLRDDAHWHDGKPVTSEDVKYTFDTIKANETYFFSSRMSIVDSIDAPDANTVVFNMNAPDVSFIAELGWYATFVMPKHIFDNGQKWEDNPASMNPVGSGPFKLGEFKQGQSITLLPNPDYHEGAPKLTKLIFTIIPDDATAFQALLNGEIDVYEGLSPANVPELQTNPDFRMALNEYPSPMRIIFNFKADKVKDKAVRQAIATAIDKEEISQKIYQGIQAAEYTMYPALIDWVANKEETSPKFNIEKAISILEGAGYKKDGDGYYVRGLEMDVFEGYGYPDAAKLMEASLKKAGIELKVMVHEFNAWNEKVYVNQNFIMELQGGFMGPDPAALGTRYATDANGNIGHYSNARFDALMKEGVATGDMEKRKAIYKEAQAIMADELPVIPIVTYAAYDANAARVTNLPIDGTGKWGWQEYTFTDIQ